VKAKHHYEESLKINPESPVAANNLAWRLAEEGSDLDRALKLAETARKELPENVNVLDTLGGCTTNAAPITLRSIYSSSASPPKPRIRVSLPPGMSCLGAGNRFQARESLNRALSLIRTSPTRRTPGVRWTA